VRVLDLTRVIAGPVATRTLAAYGADVLRVDPPFLPELSTVDTLPGKRSTLLDLRDRTDRARFDELLEAADVVVHGYRPGALQRLGFSTSHQVTVALSAWGQVGPWASRRGFDSLVQAATGIATLTGDEDAPGVMPGQVLDHATGYLAAAAAMLGLAGLRRGEGVSSTTLSLAQTSHWLQSAGLQDVAAVESVDTAPYLVELPSAEGAVTVVAPPGRIDGWTPSWSRTTTFGADVPAW
jgi:crotonobetainyl-CoA:carnitine CoA-transferase CaiB-like acyl-CoA transferase